MPNETIRSLLIATILIPIVVGVANYKVVDRDSRLFLFFLVIGFITDATMRVMRLANQAQFGIHIYNIYSLIEALFFFWYIRQKTDSVQLRKVSNIVLYATIPFWILCHTAYKVWMEGKASPSALFDITYEILAAFLTGFVLLQLAESTQDITRSRIFWFTMGIFFYCFCTFFIMGLLQTQIVLKIWFMNNIINLISYGFFTVAFSRFRWSKKEQ